MDLVTSPSSRVLARPDSIFNELLLSKGLYWKYSCLGSFLVLDLVNKREVLHPDVEEDWLCPEVILLTP